MMLLFSARERTRTIAVMPKLIPDVDFSCLVLSGIIASFVEVRSCKRRLPILLSRDL